MTVNTHFPNRKFTYNLQTKKGIAEFKAVFEADAITVFLFKNISHGCANNSIVSFSHVMPLITGQELFLLVEKDFVCLDETVDDQSDNYHNAFADKR